MTPHRHLKYCLAPRVPDGVPTGAWKRYQFYDVYFLWLYRLINDSNWHYIKTYLNKLLSPGHRRFLGNFYCRPNSSDETCPLLLHLLLYELRRSRQWRRMMMMTDADDDNYAVQVAAEARKFWEGRGRKINFGLKVAFFKVVSFSPPPLCYR